MIGPPPLPLAAAKRHGPNSSIENITVFTMARRIAPATSRPQREPGREGASVPARGDRISARKRLSAPEGHRADSRSRRWLPRASNIPRLSVSWPTHASTVVEGRSLRSRPPAGIGPTGATASRVYPAPSAQSMPSFCMVLEPVTLKSFGPKNPPVTEIRSYGTEIVICSVRSHGSTEACDITTV